MPATENNRRNLQEQILEHPSLPDHDRRRDPGMHNAIPEEMLTSQDVEVDTLFEDDEIEAPDQEFSQILKSGPGANQGKIPEDPNNRLTSDHDTKGSVEDDSEDRGESLADIAEGIQH
jgi:hypothetical protein